MGRLPGAQLDVVLRRPASAFTATPRCWCRSPTRIPTRSRRRQPTGTELIWLNVRAMNGSSPSVGSGPAGIGTAGSDVNRPIHEVVIVDASFGRDTAYLYEALEWGRPFSLPLHLIAEAFHNCKRDRARG